MTLPRLIFLGMAAVSFAKGDILLGLGLICFVLVLEWLRPGAEYRRWD